MEDGIEWVKDNVLGGFTVNFLAWGGAKRSANGSAFVGVGAERGGLEVYRLTPAATVALETYLWGLVPLLLLLGCDDMFAAL
jgi:hypothetical protein